MKFLDHTQSTILDCSTDKLT